MYAKQTQKRFRQSNRSLLQSIRYVCLSPRSLLPFSLASTTFSSKIDDVPKAGNLPPRVCQKLPICKRYWIFSMGKRTQYKFILQLYAERRQWIIDPGDNNWKRGHRRNAHAWHMYWEQKRGHKFYLSLNLSEPVCRYEVSIIQDICCLTAWRDTKSQVKLVATI